MTVFKKTILGKILGGAAKIVLPVVGAVTGIGAISGLVKGVGAVAGVAGAFKGVGKSIDKVATAAVNLVSGTTKDQRQLIQDQKEDTREDTQKLTTIDKLIRAGDTVADAAAKVGVPMTALKGLFGVPADEQVKEEITSGMPGVSTMSPAPITQAGGCAGVFIALIVSGALIVGSIITGLILI